MWGTCAGWCAPCRGRMQFGTQLERPAPSRAPLTRRLLAWTPRTCARTASAPRQVRGLLSVAGVSRASLRRSRPAPRRLPGPCPACIHAEPHGNGLCRYRGPSGAQTCQIPAAPTGAAARAELRCRHGITRSSHSKRQNLRQRHYPPLVRLDHLDQEPHD